MSLLLIILVVVLLFGGFSYGYTSNGAYPYRGYATPGIGFVLIVLLVLYLTGHLHL